MQWWEDGSEGKNFVVQHKVLGSNLQILHKNLCGHVFL